MITEFRKTFNQKWAKIILWIPILAMGLGSLVYYLPTLFKMPYGTQMVVVTINGTEIDAKQLEHQVARETARIAMIQQQLGSNADMLLKMYGMDDPRALALQSLMKDTVLSAVADSMNIQISPQTILQRLQNPMFLVQEFPDMIMFGIFNPDGSIKMAALKQYLLRTNQTMSDFEHAIEEQLKRSLVSAIVDSTLYISQNEIKRAFIQDHLSKKYSILSLSIEKYKTAVKKEGLKQEEIEEFFKTQNTATKRYWIPEKRSGIYWTFSPEDYGITVSDKQIESYYEQHKHKKYVQNPAQVQVRRIVLKISDANKRQEIMDQAQKIKQELQQDPTKFETLAQQLSHDKATAAKGGLMPFFARGEKDAVLERAAFRLQQDGEISDVIETEEGVQLLKRVSRKPITFKPLETVKKEIETTMLDQQFKDIFTKDLERKIRTIQENPQSFYDFAQEKKAVKKELNAVERSFTPEIERLFKLKKNAWDFYFDAKKGVVITLTAIEKSYEPTLNIVKDRVEQDVLQEKAQKRLEADLKKIKDEARTKSLNELQKKFDGSLELTDWIKKDDNKKTSALNQRGIPVVRMLALDTQGAVITNSDAQHGFVIKLEDIEPFDNQLFASKKNEITARLYQEKKAINQQGFIASLLRNATIKTIENESKINYSVDDEML